MSANSTIFKADRLWRGVSSPVTSRAWSGYVFLLRSGRIALARPSGLAQGRLFAVSVASLSALFPRLPCQPQWFRAFIFEPADERNPWGARQLSAAEGFLPHWPAVQWSSRRSISPNWSPCSV